MDRRLPALADRVHISALDLEIALKRLLRSLDDRDDVPREGGDKNQRAAEPGDDGHVKPVRMPALFVMNDVVVHETLVDESGSSCAVVKIGCKTPGRALALTIASLIIHARDRNTIAAPVGIAGA